MTSGGLLAINAKGDIELNEAVQVRSDVTINSEKNVSINKTLASSGDVSLAASDQVSLANNALIQVSGVTSIIGSSITFNENSSAHFVGQASLESTQGDITVNDVISFSGLGLKLRRLWSVLLVRLQWVLYHQRRFKFLLVQQI